MYVLHMLLRMHGQTGTDRTLWTPPGRYHVSEYVLLDEKCDVMRPLSANVATL